MGESMDGWMAGLMAGWEDKYLFFDIIGHYFN